MINDYADLKVQVADHLDRTDLTAVIPTLIQLGESRLNRNLRLKPMETLETGSLSTAALALPAGFIETLALFLYDSTWHEVRYISGNQIPLLLSDSPSRPEYYSVIGTDMVFERTPDQAYTYRHQYIKRLDIATDSSNWVLTNSPDAYLYTALAAAEPYLKNDARIQLWQSLASQAIDELNLMSDRTRDDGILISEMQSSTWNIYHGS